MNRLYCNMENILVIIPARGGSKGIPKKNIKELNGKPLIYYSIDVARGITYEDNICVSTDSEPGGARMLINNMSNGLLAPVRNPEMIAEAISFFADSFARYRGEASWKFPQDLQNATTNAINKVVNLKNW